MAGKGHRRGDKWKWTPRAEERLTALWGTGTAVEVAKALSSYTGQRFTRAAVTHYATQILGLRAADAQGDICINDAARALDISRSTLYALIAKKELPVTSAGKHRFLTAETWRTVQTYYAKPPEPTITLQQAARRLGVGSDWVYVRVRDGSLKAWRHGAKWCVSAADVERERWDVMKRSAADRCRAKRRAAPQPCSNCREVKPIQVVSECLCGACYEYQRRNGRPRPATR